MPNRWVSSPLIIDTALNGRRHVYSYVQTLTDPGVEAIDLPARSSLVRPKQLAQFLTVTGDYTGTGKNFYELRTIGDGQRFQFRESDGPWGPAQGTPIGVNVPLADGLAVTFSGFPPGPRLTWNFRGSPPESFPNLFAVSNVIVEPHPFALSFVTGVDLSALDDDPQVTDLLGIDWISGDGTLRKSPLDLGWPGSQADQVRNIHARLGARRRMSHRAPLTSWLTNLTDVLQRGRDVYGDWCGNIYDAELR